MESKRTSSNIPSADRSPERPPPGPALRPTAARISAARSKSEMLQAKYDELFREVEPETDPDEIKPETDKEKELGLATIGIELATSKKELIQLEKAALHGEAATSASDTRAKEKKIRELNERYLSAGDDLWQHQRKKARLTDQDDGAINLLGPRANALSECLLTLYRKSDNQGPGKKRSRPSKWRADCLQYYGVPDEGKNGTWCHALGDWTSSAHVKAAHIVPFFLDGDNIGEVLFGSRAQSLSRAGNSLLLSDTVKGWFDKYFILIVPADSAEVPITRWRIDVLSKDIHNTLVTVGVRGKDLDGRELKFLNDKRPVSRFMYFHFIMALIRIKDIQRRGWEQIWARYYQQRPFATPGPYMRRSMLLALSTHFGATDMSVIESWIADHGFDTDLKLADAEATEVARRIHETMEATEAGTLVPADDEAEDHESPDDEEYENSDDYDE